MGGCAVPELSLVVGVDLDRLQALFGEAKRLTKHSEYVVIGSLSILGVVQGKEIPAQMLISIDVDCYTKADPERILELDKLLGAGSPFEEKHGYFLDPVSPALPMLPDQWEPRLIRIELEDGIVVYFLDPNDAAVSKYARGDVRDREWIRAGLDAGLLSGPIIESRFRQTPFLDSAEREKACQALAEDRAELEKTKRRGKRT
jgi:Nucleotidyltransferase of unknown function (DUF6036)